MHLWHLSVCITRCTLNSFGIEKSSIKNEKWVQGGLSRLNIMKGGRRWAEGLLQKDCLFLLGDLNCNNPQFCHWAGKDDRNITKIFTFNLLFKIEDWFLLVYLNSLGYQSCQALAINSAGTASYHYCSLGTVSKKKWINAFPPQI